MIFKHVFGHLGLFNMVDKISNHHLVSDSNMPAERHVGGVQYEVQLRGPQLRAASSSIVKSSCSDLVELQPAAAFNEFRSTAVKVNQLLLDWNTEQDKVSYS